MMCAVQTSAQSMVIRQFDAASAAFNFEIASDKEEFLKTLDYKNLDDKKESFLNQLYLRNSTLSIERKQLIATRFDQALGIGSLLFSTGVCASNMIAWHENACSVPKDDFNLAELNYGNQTITQYPDTGWTTEYKNFSQQSNCQSFQYLCNNIELNLLLGLIATGSSVFFNVTLYYYNKKKKSTQLYQLLTDLKTYRTKKTTDQ